MALLEVSFFMFWLRNHLLCPEYPGKKDDRFGQLRV